MFGKTVSFANSLISKCSPWGNEVQVLKCRHILKETTEPSSSFIHINTWLAHTKYMITYITRYIVKEILDRNVQKGITFARSLLFFSMKYSKHLHKNLHPKRQIAHEMERVSNHYFVSDWNSIWTIILKFSLNFNQNWNITNSTELLKFSVLLLTNHWHQLAKINLRRGTVCTSWCLQGHSSL